MKKNIRLFILILFVVQLFLVGCNNSSKKKDATKDEPIELTWYFPIAVGGSLTETIEQMAEDFHKDHPDIIVNPVYTGTYDETMTKVQTSIQGNTTPDLAILLGTELFTLQDMDVIVPLDDYLSESSNENDFYPAFMENSQSDGKTWSIPFQRSTVVLYYNKDAFKEAGLDPEQPPQNWEELREYSKKLVESGMNYGVEIPSTGYESTSTWMFQGLALQNGKNLMNEDGTEVYFDTPENVEALQFWLDLSKKDEIMPEGVIDWATSPTDFIQGNTAMLYHTTGNLTNIKDSVDFDFGVAFLPAKKQYGSPTGGGNFYIFKDIPEEKQDAAWKFIEWATTPEQAAEWSLVTGYVATSEAAYETSTLKEYAESFPEALVARDQLEYASAELSTHQNGRVVKILNDNIQSVLTGKATPEEALRKAQEEAEKVLAPYQE